MHRGLQERAERLDHTSVGKWFLERERNVSARVHEAGPRVGLFCMLFEGGEVMRLIVNGEEREVAGVATVAELLAAFKLEGKILVVELNKQIIERNVYSETGLSDGDHIEIVHFVGGG